MGSGKARIRVLPVKVRATGHHHDITWGLVINAESQLSLWAQNLLCSWTCSQALETKVPTQDIMSVSTMGECKKSDTALSPRLISHQGSRKSTITTSTDTAAAAPV